MQRFKEVPILSKAALFELLSKRFDEPQKKLSQIPSPELLHDAPKAAKKIAEAILEKKKIALVGDYDVDGISATAIVVDFFRQIPYPIDAIIPNRFSDGYGISPNILNRVDADLLITVDNGISAIEAADICKARGIELVITDHHTPPKILPDAYAIVNPKLSTCSYPFEEICGAQVVWLLLGLLKKELNLSIDMRAFLDILTIAVIADIMPLKNINRAIVKEGLKYLLISKRASSIIIRDFLNKKTITAEDIAFQIAPRINSAGRLEDASIALEFLTATSTHQAYRQFEILNSLNEQRRETESQIITEAINLVEAQGEIPNIIVVAHAHWHEGVVGIIASRLVDRYERPSIVLSIKDGVAKGSARSLGNIDIFDLILKNSSYLLKFGGHKMAAGLLLDEKNIDDFRDAINKSAAMFSPEDFFALENVIGLLPSDEIDFELLDILESFEPYGEANTRPLFLVKDAKVTKIDIFGKEKSHSKIVLKQNDDQKEMEFILFRKALEMPQDQKITCSFRAIKNEFNSKISIQLIIDKIY